VVVCLFSNNMKNEPNNLIDETLKKALRLDKKIWAVSDAFIDQYGPVAAHIGSYNCAVETTIPNIINEKGDFSVTINNQVHRIIINNPYFCQPTHREIDETIVKTTSKVCLDRCLTFKADLYCDLTYIGPNDQKNIYTKKYIGEIPIMVRSVLDPVTPFIHDHQRIAQLQEDVLEIGGYFIIKGVSKVLVHQIRPSSNNIHIHKGKMTPTENKLRFTLYTEIRSSSSSFHTTITQVGINSKTKLISVVIPHIDTHTIPIGIVFKALGIESIQEMVNYIIQEKYIINSPNLAWKDATIVLEKSLEQCWNYDQEKALRHIGSITGKTNKKKSGTNAVENIDDESDITSIATLEEMSKDYNSANIYKVCLIMNFYRILEEGINTPKKNVYS
jgi:DNA-directed RNA polymerase beta subunit